MDILTFCTLAQAKSTMDFTATDYTANNPIIISALGIAATQIITYTGRSFDKAEQTDYYSLPTTRMPVRLFAKKVPVISGTISAKVGSSLADFDNYSPVDMNTIKISDLEKGAFVYQWKGGGNQGVFITYTAGLDFIDPANNDLGEGYNVYDSPAALQQANALQASHILNKSLGNKSGKASKAVKEDRRFLLIPEVVQLINEYRSPRYMGV